MRWLMRAPDPVSVLAARRARVWCKSDGRCWYCGGQLHATTFHVDHVVPRALGGANDLPNLVPACPACNLRKGARDLETFRQREQRRQQSPHRFARMLQRRHRFWFERRRQR